MIDIFLNLNSYMEPKKTVNTMHEKNEQRSTRMKKDAYWQTMVDEIFDSGRITVKDFARELGVSKDTAERLRDHETKKPRQGVLAGLFVLHMLYCPERYGQKPLERRWLVAQGWEAGRRERLELLS